MDLHLETLKKFDHGGALVWDLENGNILHLNEEREITKALYGFNIIPNEILTNSKGYGTPPIFKNLKWPTTTK